MGLDGPSNGPAGNLLLDTHTWVWVIEGDERLRNSPAMRVIEESATESALQVSAISVWEIGMLESKGRLRFAVPCLQWVLNALKAPGIRLAALTPQIAIESSRLPGSFHGDPADRIIAATARSVGATVVTRDQRLLEYAEAGHLRALAL